MFFFLMMASIFNAFGVTIFACSYDLRKNLAYNELLSQTSPADVFILGERFLVWNERIRQIRSLRSKSKFDKKFFVEIETTLLWFWASQVLRILKFRISIRLGISFVNISICTLLSDRTHLLVAYFQSWWDLYSPKRWFQERRSNEYRKRIWIK